MNKTSKRHVTDRLISCVQAANRPSDSYDVARKLGLSAMEAGRAIWAEHSIGNLTLVDGQGSNELAWTYVAAAER